MLICPSVLHIPNPIPAEIDDAFWKCVPILLISSCRFTTKAEALEGEQMCWSFGSYCSIGCQVQFHNLPSRWHQRTSSGAGKSRASVRHYGTTIFELIGHKRTKPPSAHYTIFALPVNTKYKRHKKNNYVVMLVNIVGKYAEWFVLKLLFFLPFVP